MECLDVRFTFGKITNAFWTHVRFETNKTFRTFARTMDDRQTNTCSENLLKFTRKKKTIWYITVRNHTLHIVVSKSANCKYIFNLEQNCLTEQQSFNDNGSWFHNLLALYLILLFPKSKRHYSFNTMPLIFTVAITIITTTIIFIKVH